MKYLIAISFILFVFNLQAQIWFQGGQSSSLNTSEFLACGSSLSSSVYQNSSFGTSGGGFSQEIYCTSIYNSSITGASGATLSEVIYCANAISIYKGEEKSGAGLAQGNCLTTLPIELVYFDATALEKEVLLEWETYSEINNDYFQIERSADGITWQEIKEINGAGNSTSLIYYYTVDDSPLRGISYYRLKQIDYDGQFSYSDVKVVEFNNTKNLVYLHPNPTNSTVMITGKLGDVIAFKIYNNLGQEVTQLARVIAKSENQIELNLSFLENGTYLIQTGTTFSKLIKL